MIGNKKKIMVIVPPLSGHVNPICGLVHELCKKEKEVEVIFYSDEEYRETIEKTGAMLRLYSHPTYSRLPRVNVREAKDPIGDLMNLQISFAYELLPQLLNDVDEHQPDLILHDCVFLPAKYLLEVLKNRRKNSKMPKSAVFLPNFAITEKLIKEGRMNMSTSIWTYFLIFIAFLRQIMFSIIYGISIYNPIRAFTMKNDKLNIVSLIPQLQPYREDLDNTFKFVGLCGSEEARQFELCYDIELKSVLDTFEGQTNLKLIYMSLGTLYNFNTFVFERVIDALREYDENPNRHFESSRFRVIISTGEESLRVLKDKEKKGELKIGKNVLLRAKVPQLEVLKRADLFITHSGMNSTSEAIKYAVPMVCIPLEVDQPLVARKVCDELSLGVRLDPCRLTSHQIADSIDRVLYDTRYKRNIETLSKINANFNGPVEGARLIMIHLNS